ncbi:MAG: hypothetical protein PHD83_05480 [Caldisericia bacterium]|nr:hypothetical protein [Caldisericia bacterium]
MRKKTWISLVVVFFCLLSVRAAFGEDFMNSAVIQNSGTKKYKAIRLIPAIVSAAKSDLSDLLLLNEKKEPVPYFINRYSESTSKIENTYELQLINTFVKEPDFYYDYSLKNPIQGDLQATSIDFTTTNQNFVKSIILMGSFDNLNWEMIQSGILYAVDNNNHLTLDFGRTVKYTYYRVQISDRSDKIEFQSALLRYNQELQKQVPFIERLEPTFIATEEGKQTIVILRGMKHLRLLDVTLETGDMFKRTCRYAGYQTKELYNLRFNNTQYKDLVLPLNGMLETNENGTIVIENLDDKPITIKKIIVRRYVDEIVFDGTNAVSFLLQFNHPGISDPPQYDIASYKESILQEGYDLLTVGEIKTTPPPPPPPEPKNYQWLFNTVILVVAALIGSILLVKIKKK